MTSHNQGFSAKDKGRQRRESLGMRLLLGMLPVEEFPRKHYCNKEVFARSSHDSSLQNCNWTKNIHLMIKL